MNNPHLKMLVSPSAHVPTGIAEPKGLRREADILGNSLRSIHPPFENGGTRREYTPEGARFTTQTSPSSAAPSGSIPTGAGDLKSHRSEAGILQFPADKEGIPGQNILCVCWPGVRSARLNYGRNVPV